MRIIVYLPIILMAAGTALMYTRYASAGFYMLITGATLLVIWVAWFAHIFKQVFKKEGPDGAY